MVKPESTKQKLIFFSSLNFNVGVIYIIINICTLEKYFSSHKSYANNIRSDCPLYILSGWCRQMYDELSLWLLP